VFDLSSSKLILLAVIALLVVGPKEFPALLRTVGYYVGMIRRQAAEFRAQFDEAMKESEIAEIKKTVEDFGREAESAVRDAETAVQREADAIKSEVSGTLDEMKSTVSGDAHVERSELPAPATTETAGALPAPDAAIEAAVDAASPPPVAPVSPADGSPVAAADAKSVDAKSVPEKVGA
jgi:sec-independent protein translocase protein TatB